MGLYPRNGAIAAGSDADIAILDPAVRRKVRREELHESDYSPWEGWEVHAWPVATIMRGQVVVEDGAFHGAPSVGRWLEREIPRAVRARPAVFLAGCAPQTAHPNGGGPPPSH